MPIPWEPWDEEPDSCWSPRIATLWPTLHPCNRHMSHLMTLQSSWLWGTAGLTSPRGKIHAQNSALGRNSTSKGKNKHIFKDISFNWHLFSTFFISLFPTLQDTLKDQFLLLPICPWEIFTEILVSASSSSYDRCLCMFLLYFFFTIFSNLLQGFCLFVYFSLDSIPSVLWFTRKTHF